MGPRGQPSAQTAPSWPPSPTNEEDWTQHPFVPTTFRLWALACPLPLLCESVCLPVPRSLSTAVQTPQLFPPGLQTGSQRANGKPKESRETKRPLHRTALDRRPPLEEPQAAGPSRRGWEAPEPPARAEGGRSSFYVLQVSPACLALLQPLSPPAQAVSVLWPQIHFHFSLSTYLFI